MTDFASLSRREQIGSVRSALGDLLTESGTVFSSLDLVLHSFNTTFRLRGPDGDCAIRVNLNSTRSFAQVKGEVAWTAALQADGRVRAPAPIGLFGGEALSTLRVPGIDRELPVVAYSWLPGKHIGDNFGPKASWELGTLMAKLHEASRGWSLPVGAERPKLDSVLDGLPWRLPEKGPFREVFERSDAVLKKLAARPRQLIHFDLHFGNIKQTPDGLCVFDFDDCVVAWPAVDAAQALFYLRGSKNDAGRELAFWEGAGTNPEGLGVSPEELEFLIGGRAILLATDLLANITPDLAALAPNYVKVTGNRLDHLLQTGRFDPSVSKLSDFES